MRLVIDASVIVKWVVRIAEAETDVEPALALLESIRLGRVEPLQPPHWLAEVAAVLARVQPEGGERVIELLDAMELPTVTEVSIYRRAIAIAASLKHHVFDTLYHALALEREAVLVTADERYHRTARPLGSVTLLRDLALPT